jgi:hypothetical protein
MRQRVPGRLGVLNTEPTGDPIADIAYKRSRAYLIARG